MELADEGCWRQLDKQPENGQCCHRNSKHAFKRLSDSFGVAGTVIVADDGLSPLTNALHGNPYHLLDRAGNGHATNGNITAIMLQ